MILISKRKFRCNYKKQIKDRTKSNIKKSIIINHIRIDKQITVISNEIIQQEKEIV